MGNALYPTTIYEHKGLRRGPQFDPSHINQLGDEIEAIERALGTGVSGSSGSTDARLTAVEAAVSSTLRGPCVNLRVRNTVGSENFKLDITADLISIEGATVEDVSAAADVTLAGAQATAGLGGRDDATTESSSQWLYVWLGYNPTSNLVKGMLSTGSTRAGISTGTGFPGYTKWRRVGAVRNDAGSNFLRFRQNDCWVTYDNQDGVMTTANPGGGRILSAGAATTITDVTAGAAVLPATSRLMQLNVILISTGSPGGGTAVHVYPGDTIQTGNGMVCCTNGLLAANELRNMVWLATDATQKIRYKLSLATNTSVYLDVWGYHDPVM